LITPTWPPAASVAFSIIMGANSAAWTLFRLRPRGQRRGLHVHDRVDRRQRRRGAGRGFLLNNELTDFNFDSLTHPNRVEGGKRPRSSMSPTIVLEDGQPLLALVSPGGSTIITVVLQILLDRLDLGATLPQAIAAPRASHDGHLGRARVRRLTGGRRLRRSTVTGSRRPVRSAPPPAQAAR